MDETLMAGGVGAGAQGIAGIVNAFNAAKVNAKNAQELAAIKAQYQALIPPQYNIDLAKPPDQLQLDLAQLPSYRGDLATPQFEGPDKAMLPQFRQDVGFVREANPTTIGETQNMTAGRQAQLDALQKYRDISQSGTDPQMEAMAHEAARQAQAQAQSRAASVQQDFQRRGAGGSGMNLLGQLQSGADSMDRLATMNQQTAMEGYRNRLDAMRQGANLGGQLRQEDIGLQGRNADVINAFNQRLSAGQQQNLYNNRNAADQNAMNLHGAELQNIAARNSATGQQYAAQLGQQSRSDTLANQAFENRMRALGFNNSANNTGWQQGMSREEAIRAAQGGTYQGQLQKLGGLAGVQQQQAGQRLQAGQDKAAMINALGGAVATGAGAYGNAAAQKRLENRQDTRWNENVALQKYKADKGAPPAQQSNGDYYDEDPYGDSYNWG